MRMSLSQASRAFNANALNVMILKRFHQSSFWKELFWCPSERSACGTELRTVNRRMMQRHKI